MGGVFLMKKLICLICIFVITILTTISVFAGDIPESLLWNDEAQLFFGEVISYYPDNNEPSISVSPVKKIKGDLNIGSKQIYLKPNPIGGAKIVAGNVYLFAYCNEANPLDIFEVTSYDTKSLKVKGIQGDMWKRFEEYINNGEYEKAEQERLSVPLLEFLNIKRDTTDTVEISVDGQVYEVDDGDFFDIAEDIVLTDIENVQLTKEGFPEGIYINANTGVDGFAFITYDGYVDKNSMMMSRLPVGDYKISYKDLEKICSLLPVDVPIVDNKENIVEKQLPPLNNPPANFWYWVIDNPTEAKAIGILVIVLLMGGVGFLVGYRIRKKKARR